MKNKKVLIGVALAVLLLVGAGGFFFMSRSEEPVEEETGSFEESLPELSASEIGLTLNRSADGRTITFTIDKAGDLQSAEWELTWDADNKQATTPDDIPKLTFAKSGTIDFEGKSAYESEELVMGTCSSGRCVYDTGVENIMLLMKVTKKDGKEYQVESRLES